jgi:hypothetical protein
MFRNVTVRARILCGSKLEVIRIMTKASRKDLMELCALGFFDGLTAEQACQLLYRGIGNDESLLLLNRELDSDLVKATRLYGDVSYYLSIIKSRQPVGLTRQGNLPLTLARELRDAGLYEDLGASAMLKGAPMRTELDAPYLHYINVLTQAADFTRIARKNLGLTEPGEEFLTGEKAPNFYTYLFVTHAAELDWTHMDGYPGTLFVQRGLLFSLLLVWRYGDEPRDVDFYFWKFRSAFPYLTISPDLPPGAQDLDAVRVFYFMQIFERFLARFGLVEVNSLDPDLPLQATVRKTDLFDRFIAFDEALAVPLPAGSRTARGQAAGRAPEYAPRGEFTEVYQFKITLKGMKPPIWRRIRVPANFSFWDLSSAIIDAMGWYGGHLHQFYIRHPGAGKEVCIGLPDPDFPSFDEIFPETEERIAGWFSTANPAATFEYDFGDGWEHTVRLEKILPREEGTVYPECVTGRRACPLEDIGGVPGYERFLRAFKDASHPEHEMMVEQVYEEFDPEHFDPDEVSFEDPRERWGRAEEGLL